MAELPDPGWHHDPSGIPGRLRWWDGQRWSDLVTDVPPTRSQGVRIVWAAAVLFTVMMLLVTWPLRDQTAGAEPSASPSPQQRAGQQGDPQPTARPSATPKRRPLTCSVGDPTDRDTHIPLPDTITGGGFRATVPPGWRTASAQALRFADDAAAVEDPNNISQWRAVGAITATREAPSPVPATDVIATCLTGYSTYARATVTQNKVVPVTVPGSRETAGRLLTLSRSGSTDVQVLIVVGDIESNDHLPFFIAQAPVDPQRPDAVLETASTISRE